MKKINNKGQAGYLKAEKIRLLSFTLVEFIVIIALVIFGIVQTGTRMNIFTVVAILGCLPASKMLVEFVTMAPYRGLDEEKQKELSEKAPLLTKVYDLVITGHDKVMPVDVFVISGHTLIGYTSTEKVDEIKLQRYLKEMLANNHVDKVTVKVLHDYNAFLARAEGMNNIASVEKQENRRRERAIRQLLLSTSM